MTSTEYNRAYGIVVLYNVCMCVYIHIPSNHKFKILLLTTEVYSYSLNHGSTDEYLIIHGGVSQKMHGIKNSSPSLIAIPCFGRHVLTCSQRWAISRYPVENNHWLFTMFPTRWAPTSYKKGYDSTSGLMGGL